MPLDDCDLGEISGGIGNGEAVVHRRLVDERGRRERGLALGEVL
jgi:hypothetical protein